MKTMLGEASVILLHEEADPSPLAGKVDSYEVYSSEKLQQLQNFK